MTVMRRYGAPLRSAQATRQAILAAAARPALQGGWAGATIAAKALLDRRLCRAAKAQPAGDPLTPSPTVTRIFR